MKRNTKYYLICAMFFVLGASVAAGVRYCFGIDLVRPANYGIDADASFSRYLIFTSRYLMLVSLDFLMAFTIYACPVAAFLSIYTGAGIGIAAIRYCTSGLNVFTHAAMLIFLLGYLCVFTVIGTNSSLYRDTLRTAAPSPKELLKLKATMIVLCTYLRVCAVTVGLSTAMFFFFKFFPYNSIF